MGTEKTQKQLNNPQLLLPTFTYSLKMSSITQLFLLFAFFSIALSIPLADIFHNLEKKQNELKQQEMMDFISKNLPEGIDAPNPKIAEFETFKSNKMSNFVSDGNGHLQFRQFRRMNLGSIMSRHQAGI